MTHPLFMLLFSSRLVWKSVRVELTSRIYMHVVFNSEFYYKVLFSFILEFYLILA